MAADNTLRALTAIRRFTRAVRAQDASLKRVYGVSHVELRMLRTLGRYPGSSVGELAEASVTSSSRVSAVVRGLVDRGLVLRVAEAGRRRSARLFTSREGDRIARAATKAARAHFSATLKVLPVASRDQLATLLELWVSEALIDTTPAPPIRERRGE